MGKFLGNFLYASPMHGAASGASMTAARMGDMLFPTPLEYSSSYIEEQARPLELLLMVAHTATAGTPAH